MSKNNGFLHITLLCSFQFGNVKYMIFRVRFRVSVRVLVRVRFRFKVRVMVRVRVWVSVRVSVRVRVRFRVFQTCKWSKITVFCI